MKKILCFILCLCFFIPTGCNKKSSDVTAVTTGLSFTAEISYKNNTVSYSVTIFDNSDTEIKTLSDSLSGLCYTFSGETVTVSYNGLEYNIPISSLPEGIITDFLYSVFCTVKENNSAVMSENDEYYISDRNEKYSFKIYLGETGLPLKIEDSENGITAIIKNASII